MPQPFVPPQVFVTPHQPVMLTMSVMPDLIRHPLDLSAPHGPRIKSGVTSLGVTSRFTNLAVTSEVTKAKI